MAQREPDGPPIAERRPLDSLAVDFWWRARGASEYALSHWTSADKDEQVRVAASLGLAVEMLAMARVASADPALLATGSHPQSRVMLSRANLDGLIDIKALRTIHAREAVGIIELLDPGFSSGDDARGIIDFRNAAVHLARVDVDKMEALVGALVRFVGEVHRSFGPATDAEFWEQHHLELVQALREVAADRAELRYEALKAAARARLQVVLIDLSSSQAEVQLKGLEKHPARLSPAFESRHEVERRECPACGRQAYLHFSLEFLEDFEERVEFQREGWPDVWVEVSARWEPVALECRVCGLRLDKSLLPFVPGVKPADVRPHVLDSDEVAWYWLQSTSSEEMDDR